MKTSDLNRIIKNYSTVEARTLLDSYKEEFNEYKKAVSKKGATVHLKILRDEPLVITKAEMRNLANYFLNKDLMELEINFLVDYIWAADSKYESERIFEIIESFTDPGTNGNLTNEYLKRILNEIG